MSALSNDSIGALSLPVPSFPNPNIQRNRVPGKAELLSLKAFVDSNARIAHVLDEEIRHLKRSHDSIQERYVGLQLEMEATQSELHKARDLLDAVQKQRAALRVEQEDLYALMHPIRCCPDDILKEIFELTMLDLARSSDARMNQAICCSSVCQRWRDVVLNTPKLWTGITFTLSKSMKSQKILRTCILPRVRHALTDVSVRTINSDALLDLSRCGLQDIPVIGTLTLKVSTPGDAQNLFGPLFNPPTGTMKWLKLHCTDFLEDPDSQLDGPELDILRLAERFPPFSKLLTKGLPTVTFTSGVTNFNITELNLSDLVHVDILRLLQCVPRLESMIIRRTALVADNMQSMHTVSSIKLIHLLNVTGETWMENIEFPQLKDLAHDREATEAFYAFLARHKSIIELGYTLHGDEIVRLATVAPQLENLTIAPPLESLCRSLDGSSPMPFPSLKSLAIVLFAPPNDLTLAAFETLVCAICLPMRHPKSQVTERSSFVSTFATVVMDFATVGDYLGWHDSDLYKESTKRTDEKDPRKVYLSWPEWE